MNTEERGQVPQDGDRESQTAPVSAPAQSQEPEQFDADYVRQLRREAADYRKKLRELEEQVKTFSDEKLSETERLQKRVAEMERAEAEWQRERQEQTLQHRTMMVAAKLGIVDAEAAYKLLDMAAVEFDDKGQPTNLEKLLTDMISKRSYLVAAPATSATNPPRGHHGTPTLDEIKLWTPEEINRRWDEVQRVLEGGNK